LLLVDAILIAVIVTLGVRLQSAWTSPPAVGTPAGQAARASGEGNRAPSTEPKPAPPTPAQFAVVAERNLFSPTRTESAPEPPAPPAKATAAVLKGAVANAPKPLLHGIVLGGNDGPRAFIQDPRTRRVYGYGVGDQVGESRVDEIKTDRVVLRQGADVTEIMLRDPAKPKPPPPPPVAAASPTFPGQPPIPGAPGVPPQPRVPAMGQPPQPFGQPPQPFGQPPVPGAPGAEESPVLSQGQSPIPGRPPMPVAPGMPLPTQLPGSSS
jgi:hypothetical protein